MILSRLGPQTSFDASSYIPFGVACLIVGIGIGAGLAWLL